jgi:hypothetical protein
MTAYVTAPRRTRIRVARAQHVVDTSDAGKPRVVDLEAATLYAVEIIHPLMSSAERAAVETFWAANRGAVIDLAAEDGYTYECPLVGAIDWQTINSARSTGRVSLVGNRAAS